jgi:hypothetical protein
MESDQNYLYQLIGLAWDSASGEAVVIDLLISALVVFLIRRLQKVQKLPRFSNFISKVLIVEDDYGRTVITFLLLFVFQIVFLSPYKIYHKDKTTIQTLHTSTNQMGGLIITLETNNIYYHDQWAIAPAVSEFVTSKPKINTLRD